MAVISSCVPKRQHCKKRKLASFARLRADDKGVTAIEFAFIAPVLFLVVMAIIELGLSLLVEVVLDNAVADAARQIRTGQVHQEEGFNAASFKNAILEKGGGLLKAVENDIYIDVEAFENFGDIPEPQPLVEDGEVVMEQGWAKGERNEVVLVRVLCAWPMFTSKMMEIFGTTTGGKRLLVSTEIFRNEPYSATGGTNSSGET
ncbi:hypothetical protein GCM10007094_38340 [Pseudovibrio japonicus]|uniref:TadE-like domain-containing protein n=1 Tax=Pseudovibrio japonicus TaxID=366534 RepID=A0ABQ3EQQ0_9HYPH|nr:TadE/TadG family type IV pilus assembly protein [Pseudovibrio japonicus]GHB45277.1 hypothetical protein GCM10007094_38340 [Pseudovibrio japonicus]